MTKNIHLQKKHVKYVLIVLAFAMLFLASFHDAFYKQTIVKIKKVDNTYIGDKENSLGQTEETYDQAISAVITNGSAKGKTVTFSNRFSTSETLSDEYKKGDKLFVKLKDTSDSPAISVLYEKRDSYIYLFAGIFILMLIFIFQRQGIMTLLSCGVNIVFFFFCLRFYESEHFFNWIWLLEIAFFIVVTLLFVSGFHRKTLGAILSCFVTVALVSALYMFTISQDADISYEMMPCMLPNLPLAKVFMISTVIGMLGAVMDIAVTINASVSELMATSQHCTRQSIVNSIVEIGHDTMGIMVNVLFFSYLSGSFPLIVLKFSNGYGLDTIISVDYIFDIIRFLTGSIGIVLAIPVSGLIAVFLFRKGLVKEA